MSDKNVSVIVINYAKDNGSIFGMRLIDTPFESLPAARAQAEILKGIGVAVIVRPHYNEGYGSNKPFFREWQSFNGEDFKEVRFNIPVDRRM